jgi:hypothetical protein
MSTATSAIDHLPLYSFEDGSAPPPYIEAVKQAVVVLEQKMKENPQLMTAKLSESLGKNAVEKALIRDIQSLIETVSRLDKLFRDVYLNLVAFDADKQPGKDGQITEFAPIWLEIKGVSRLTLHSFSPPFIRRAEPQSLFITLAIILLAYTHVLSVSSALG